MKTTIIFFVIFTCLFWVLYKLLYAALLGNPIESARVILGKGSALSFFSGLCRLLSWIFGALTIVMLLIYLL